MRRERAMALFEEGYNCAQSVFLAFSDLHGMDTHTAAVLSSSFGGGMGRLREVCGAVSGMFLTAGIVYGYDDPGAREEKAVHYARIQELAKAFEEKRFDCLSGAAWLIGKAGRTDAEGTDCRVL